MEVNILAFGIAKEITGSSSFKLQVKEQITVADLKKELESKYVALAKLSSFLLAINDEYGDAADMIQPGDEIAIIPPVSGG